MLPDKFVIVNLGRILLNLPSIDKQPLQAIGLKHANRLSATSLKIRFGGFPGHRKSNVLCLFDQFNGVWNSAAPICDS